MALPYEKITQIPNSDPAPDAEPSLWNTRYDEIDANFAYVQGEVDNVEAEIDDITERLGVVEVEGPLAITKAVKSDWHYRTNKTAMELWTPYWTLIDMAEKLVVLAIAGDDSIDVDSTAGLTVGGEYVIKDTVNSEVIKVAAILTANRFLAEEKLQNNYTTGATVSKTSFTVEQALSKAVIKEGDVYLCGPLMLGDAAMKSCIVHRNDQAGVSLYFKDAAHTSWTPIPIAWSRTSDVDGTIEDEYLFPADGGDVHMKVLCDSVAGESDAEIYGIIFLSEYSDLGGWHTPPQTPVNAAPADAATDIGEQPVLVIGSYYSQVGSIQAAARFQVVLATPEVVIDPLDTGDFADYPYDPGWEPENMKWDSGPINGTDLSAVVPAGILLDGETQYRWRACVCDYGGSWSDWSEPTTFTTKASFAVPTVTPPTLTAPTSGSTVSSLTPTLTTGAFAVANGTDTHEKTQWQVRKSAGTYDAPVLDLESVTDLTSHDMAMGLIWFGGKYLWRARHYGTAYGWSDWSAESPFNAPASVSAPSYSMSAIKTYPTGFMTNMQYDALNDVLYIAAKGVTGTGAVVHRFKSGVWDDAIVTNSLIDSSRFLFPILLTPNGIAVGTPYNGVAYATKADFVFSQKYFEAITDTNRYPIMWQAALAMGAVARLYGVRSAWYNRTYYNPNMEDVFAITSNDEFATSAVEKWQTGITSYRFLRRPRRAGWYPYFEVLNALKLGSTGKELVGLSVNRSTKSAAIIDWATKQVVGSLPLGADSVTAMCDAGEYGLFVGTSTGEIYKSIDGGATLSIVAAHLDTQIQNIIQVNNELMLASSYPGGRLFASSNGGNTWVQVTGWTYGNISCMAKKADNVVYATTIPANSRHDLNPSSVYTITITR